MATADRILLDTLAATALANVATEYPFHLTHLTRGSAEILPPRALNPVFFGAYDWHSCVHMHWTLARCLRLQPLGDQAAAIAAHFGSRITPAGVTVECDYFAAPERSAFERPYGWGWLLQLTSELDALAARQPQAARWRDVLAPLAALIADRFVAWLPRADFPVRAGAHGNSAFALILALQYARRAGHGPLAVAIEERAARWYAADRAYPAGYEPGGDDFLSGGLCEAVLMSRLLSHADWPRWWAGFAPADGSLSNWTTPVPVADPSDPKIVHLHGLNLSRAWCWRQLRPMLPDSLRETAAQATEAHLGASLGAATQGDYVGTHWLASFALLAVTGDRVEGS